MLVMPLKTTFLLSFALLFIGACQNPIENKPKNLNDFDQSHRYVLGTNDTINIRVFNERDLSGQFTINEQGGVTLPLIGAVTLSGLTPQEAEQVVKAEYSNGYLINPVISVEIEKYRDFFIIGEVQSPGSYEYQPDLTVMKAVALAGGFTYRANQKSFNLSETEEKSNLQLNISRTYKISPGDVIIVKERLF